jgi:arginase
MPTRRLTLLDAPSNLGLRPPAEGIVPGVYKLAGALRDAGLLGLLGAEDAGVVTPPRYDPAWDGATLRNAPQLVAYTERLAQRVGALLAAGRFPVVLGGDCSILIACLRAVGATTAEAALVFVDGHLDYRHPGNSPATIAAAGEDLAVVTGLGPAALTAPSPLVAPTAVVAVGSRPDDVYADEARERGIAVITADEARRSAEIALPAGDAVWLHVDLDVLDPQVLPAVDSPAPGGLGYDDLGRLLAQVLADERVVGMDVTIYDPDLDPSLEHPRAIAELLAGALAPA